MIARTLSAVISAWPVASPAVESDIHPSPSTGGGNAPGSDEGKYHAGQREALPCARPAFPTLPMNRRPLVRRTKPAPPRAIRNGGRLRPTTRMGPPWPPIPTVTTAETLRHGMPIGRTAWGRREKAAATLRTGRPTPVRHALEGERQKIPLPDHAFLPGRPAAAILKAASAGSAQFTGRSKAKRMVNGIVRGMPKIPWNRLAPSTCHADTTNGETAGAGPSACSVTMTRGMWLHLSMKPNPWTNRRKKYRRTAGTRRVAETPLRPLQCLRSSGKSARRQSDSNVTSAA